MKAPTAGADIISNPTFSVEQHDGRALKDSLSVIPNSVARGEKSILVYIQTR